MSLFNVRIATSIVDGCTFNNIAGTWLSTGYEEKYFAQRSLA